MSDPVAHRPIDQPPPLPPPPPAGVEGGGDAALEEVLLTRAFLGDPRGRGDKKLVLSFDGFVTTWPHVRIVTQPPPPREGDWAKKKHPVTRGGGQCPGGPAAENPSGCPNTSHGLRPPRIRALLNLPAEKKAAG